MSRLKYIKQYLYEIGDPDGDLHKEVSNNMLTAYTNGNQFSNPDLVSQSSQAATDLINSQGYQSAYYISKNAANNSIDNNPQEQHQEYNVDSNPIIIKTIPNI